MTIFPPRLSATLRAWRVDQKIHADTWDSGTGAWLLGGRWNPKGAKAVYCSFDAATAILELAVHQGFAALDIVPHVSTVLEIDAPTRVHIVQPEDVPNPAWLMPGLPNAGQQAFGFGLLQAHAFVAIPSAVSHQSWNLLFDPERARGLYRLVAQERLALDTRLNRPHR